MAMESLGACIPTTQRKPMEVHASKWPAEFICPISGSVMADPVIVSSGQTYERRCIEAWMDLGHMYCVKQNTSLDWNLIIPNAGLKAAITNMAKSKGMRSLPSPPPPELAYALARRLVQEIYHADARVLEPWSPQEDASVFDDDTDAQSGPIRIETFKNEEPERGTEHEEDGQDDDLYGEYEEAEEEEAVQEEEAQHDDLYGRLEKSRISESEGSDAHAETSKIVRKAIHLKSSSSLPPLNGPVEALDVRRGHFATGSSRLQPAEEHRAGYARAADQGFIQVRAVRESGRGGSTGGGSLTDPLRNSRPTAGEALLESTRGARELPPHLLTRPSSYSSSEPLHSSSPPPSTSDPLVQRLRAEKEQEAAVSELRQLSREPNNRITLCRTDIIEALLPLFRSKNPNVQVNAVASLVNLSIEKPNKVTIVRAGAVRFLVEVLNNGFEEAQEHAAGAAFSLAIADENKHPMGVLNAITPLLQLLHTGPDGARLDAAMALYHLSLLQSNKSKLVKVGAVPILLNLAQSRERPDIASRALIILSNVASIPEGRAALIQLNAIPVLVRLLAFQGNRGAAPIPEQAAAVLVLLSKGNFRFKSVAQSAGAQELLTALVEKGTIRAREKALALLAIMKESSSGPDEQDAGSVLSRQYLRMRVDGGQMNSSAF